MARRIVTLVLELDGEGNPVEINRAWSEDEVLMPNGSLGVMPKQNVDEGTLAGLLPDHAAVLAQLQTALHDIEVAKAAAKDAQEARAAAEADRERQVSAAVIDRDEKVAAAETAQKAAEADRDLRLAEKDSRIALLEAQATELQAQVAALTAEPERSIHKAYLRAALASIERLAEVDAAVQSAGAVKWELWANATTISQDDPDVNQIADALGVDLDAVFAAARAIRTARGG